MTQDTIKGLREAAVERAARIIDPTSFKAWEGTFNYGVTNGETLDDARATADHFHKKAKDEARDKAREILASDPPPFRGEALVYDGSKSLGQRLYESWRATIALGEMWPEWDHVPTEVQARHDRAAVSFTCKLSASPALVTPGEEDSSPSRDQGQAVGVALEGSFQARVLPWMLECFGPDILQDGRERNHRFLEESLELVQALGCTANEAHQLVDYTFSRDLGEPSQEVGGVMVCMAALCIAHGLDMDAAAETELARIWTKVPQIRAKHASKPKHSPLPGASPSSAKSALGDSSRDAPETAVTLGVREALEALEPFAKLARPIDDEAGRQSHIDLITKYGEDDELAVTSFNSETTRFAVLRGDDFRRAAQALAALTAPVGEGDQGNQGFNSVSRTSPPSPVEATRGGWRAMVDAPRDGSTVHLWSEGNVWPDAGNWVAYGPSERLETGVEGIWQYAENLIGDTGEYIENPTHWRPLPTPPTEGEGS